MIISEQTHARAAIHKYLSSVLRLEQSLDDSDELLLSGLLDSLSVVRFVSFLELEFDCIVPPEDITVTNLANVNAVIAYLAAKGD